MCRTFIFLIAIVIISIASKTPVFADSKGKFPGMGNRDAFYKSGDFNLSIRFGYLP